MGNNFASGKQFASIVYLSNYDQQVQKVFVFGPCFFPTSISLSDLLGTLK